MATAAAAATGAVCTRLAQVFPPHSSLIKWPINQTIYYISHVCGICKYSMAYCRCVHTLSERVCVPIFFFFFFDHWNWWASTNKLKWSYHNRWFASYFLYTSSFSNLHGTEIKKNNSCFSKIRWRRESWHVLVITIHYPQSPIPKSLASFFFLLLLLLCTHWKRSTFLRKRRQQKRNQKQIFSLFSLNTNWSMCLHNPQAHTPYIKYNTKTIHLTMAYIP